MTVSRSTEADGRSVRDLHALVDDALDWRDRRQVSVADFLGRLGNKVYGPLLFVLGLFGVSPLGAIPGATIAVGLIVLILSIQLFFGKPYPWIPRRVRDLEISVDRLTVHRGRLHDMAGRINRVARPRLRFVENPVTWRVVAAACFLQAAIAFPLALVPFGAAAPTSVFLLFGVAVTVRDGVWMIAGFVWSGVSLAISYALAVSFL